METTSITIENLNDLIQIHNDRIAGYERATENLEGPDTELKYLFTNLIGESHECKMELATEVQVLGGDVETGTTFSGSIHRAWMNVKDAFGGGDRESVLESCEFGEDAIQKAYKTALGDETLPAYLREIISRQQTTLKAAHDKIKALRDAQKQ